MAPSRKPTSGNRTPSKGQAHGQREALTVPVVDYVVSDNPILKDVFSMNCTRYYTMIRDCKDRGCSREQAIELIDAALGEDIFEYSDAIAGMILRPLGAESDKGSRYAKAVYEMLDEFFVENVDGIIRDAYALCPMVARRVVNDRMRAPEPSTSRAPARRGSTASRSKGRR